jgi:hypothetical protein
MYDTLHIHYNYDDNGYPDTDKIIYKISDVNHSEYANGSTCISGSLDNLRVNINEMSVTIKGSLAKYYLGNNFQTLSQKTTSEAIEKLSDDLNLDINLCKVSRIDLSTNFITDFKPTLYYDYLDSLMRFQRLVQPDSLYYKQSSKRLLFYDKTKWAKQMRIEIPKQFEDQNILRYEMVLNKGITKYLKLDKITMQDLHGDYMYSRLVDEWYNFYNRIEKRSSKEIVLNTNNIKSPKDFDKELLIYLTRTKGLDYIDNMIEDLKARNAFTSDENYSRSKAKYRGYSKVEIDPEDIISEISEKVEEVYQREFNPPF